MNRLHKHIRAIIKSELTPKTIFFATVACFPAFFFQRSVLFSAVILLVFMYCNYCRRGTIRLLPPFFLILSLVFFSILSPAGRILFRIGKFPVTLGAITSGVRRGIVLLGMIFLSQFAISRDMRLPGRAGAFLAEVFTYFDAINAEKISLQPGHVMKNLDDRLYAVYYGTQTSGPVQEHPQSNSRRGTIFFITLLVFVYALFFASFFLKTDEIIWN